MKKRIAVILLILMTATTALSAGSMFDVGVVGYYSYWDLENQNFEAFIPAVRVQWNILDYIGVSADALYFGQDEYEVNYGAIVLDAVFRLPLGFIEPYVAVGPAYFMAFTADDAYVDENSFASNVRAGLDLNITPSLSVGAEANFFVDDVAEFIDGFSSLTPEEQVEAIKYLSKIGITVKFCF